MFGERFELNEMTLGIVEEIGRHMPGGFFIYKAKQPEELLYANHAVFDIFGCKDLAEFRELTGYTFKGMLHPDDYAAIADSITEQIGKNTDNMDYVEYRIVRKDGSVRWVDDYGHFTDTQAYGGIYYVFISDITEKRERERETVQKALQDVKRAEAENRRLVEEIESAAKLADLMGSVASLLTNMPAMSFSKDAETGRYLACNQSFAEYAHKKDPEGVIGLTDHEIFDPATAAHFVDDDRKALEMDEPYIFFEDVPDARGNLRNLQTTKMKFTDSDGRLCTLGMCVDVTEMTRIKAAEAEAQIKLQAAEAASRAKTAFLSNMSHEIRTPITAILGMNELIRRESSDENVLGYANNIEKAGVSLLGIINDILDFSKIEAGKMELVDADYQVRGLVTDALNLTRLRAEEKGLLLKAEIDPKLPAVLRGDELRLKQILTNLLSNAVKYTEKGTVRFAVSVEQKTAEQVRLTVSVSDTGIGIREEEREKLFSAFDRLDVTRTKGIEGTGLGLAITSQMLELMGSRLELKSEYGRGSDFFFTISQPFVGDTCVGDFDPMASFGTGAEHHADDAALIAPGARLLIVDDTPLNLQVIAGLLKRTRVQIDTAGSGEECIDRFGAGTYDMVFLDYRMPQMDGIETLRRLRELYPGKAAHTPIVCLTASAVVGDREKMLAAGFDDYLSKPVNITEMEKMMRKYLQADMVGNAAEHPAEKDGRTFAIGAAVTAQGDDAELRALPAAIFSVEELDPASGVEFCGDAEELMAALAIYEASVETKADSIENAAADGDMETYINLVHSLKSTSRAIGATALSELAFTLEQAGKDGDGAVIAEKTPELLSRYRALRSQLQEVISCG